ncbi:TldD/PmbA family protein [candidate division TA06 bacterium]|uniref:TldD/PmbA family protein n=1 Tax=candidate division TA06 bacterium TaxID=2250710 RepID=A0A523US78_UNCT6|nr:MAG: TldD/PmbA family protein [candidate division TA06 bacterium]
MEKLLEMAKKVSDKAEVYSIGYTHNSVSFKNAKLHGIESKIQSGASLRIIKDNKLGFAYTRNLANRQELLQNAIDSLEGEVEANYDFPLTEKLARIDTFDPSLENVLSTQMVEESARVCDLLKSETDAEISVSSTTYTETIRVMNSCGTDISGESTFYVMYGSLVFPGSASGIWGAFLSKDFRQMPENILNEMIKLYTSSSKIVEPKGGKMKIMFMPNSMIALKWRISIGTSSKSVYEKVSPIANKVGEKIFDERITIHDDPLNDKHPGARAFDDEGVACKPLTIIENGVLKSFYYDLDYASKLKAKPTGHGHRTTAWGGDPISIKPVPALTHMIMEPGKKSFSDLVKSIDRGIILEGALGAHSGNIPNGDFSIGVSPGLYVENGEIVGRVKDAMVAGNIYEMLKQVVDIGDTLYPSWGTAWLPPILCDNVSVTTKN